jgi:uncharacterized protein YifN (PemK superfamily)
MLVKMNGQEVVFKPDSLYRMKAQLDPKFHDNFFDRKVRKMFGDTRHYWSKSRQVLVVTQKRFGKIHTVEYKLSGDELGKLTLSMV